MLWISAAALAAIFAALTVIFAKCGLKKTDSDLALALRAVFIFAFAWALVFIFGSQNCFSSITPRSWVFLILSGVASGGSWLFYFKAISLGDMNKVSSIDKFSTVLAVILAIICFGETSHLAIKLVATAILGFGIVLMVDFKQKQNNVKGKRWLVYAVLSSVCTALMSVFSKLGVADIDPNFATAVRSSIVLVIAWAVVFAGKKQVEIKKTEPSEMLFILLSGIATATSWVFYYYAVKHGDVSVVAPIEKLSILVVVGFSFFAFKEKISKKAFLGLALIVFATLIVAIFR